MPNTQDDDLDGTRFEGDRPGAHPVDVLGELPIDGEPTAEAQLMPDAELDPEQVEGDRFDVGDDDLGSAPDLEEEPDAPDLRPDTVRRFDESGDWGELAPDDLDESLTAPLPDAVADDTLAEPDELP
jgi:hypothetical protein